jgi:hypothetical protein
MLWKIIVVTSTLSMCILDQGRTIAAPVDYEGILKMEGASALPLASTFKCQFRPDSVVVQINEQLAGNASWQAMPAAKALKGGNPPLARWDSRETAAAAAAAAAGCANKPAPARGGGGGVKKTNLL